MDNIDTNHDEEEDAAKEEASDEETRERTQVLLEGAVAALELYDEAKSETELEDKKKREPRKEDLKPKVVEAARRQVEIEKAEFQKAELENAKTHLAAVTDAYWQHLAVHSKAAHRVHEAKLAKRKAEAMLAHTKAAANKSGLPWPAEEVDIAKLDVHTEAAAAAAIEIERGDVEVNKALAEVNEASRVLMAAQARVDALKSSCSKKAPSSARASSNTHIKRSEDTEKHTKFIMELANFHQRRGTPFEAEPSINDRIVDLYRLYLAIAFRGGYDQVNEQYYGWRTVAMVFCSNHDSGVVAAVVDQIRTLYYRFLAAYEIKAMMRKEPPPKEKLEDLPVMILRHGKLVSRRIDDVDGENYDFVKKLITHHAQRQTPLVLRWIVGGRYLNHLLLYKAVAARGYHNLGENMDAWRKLAIKLDYTGGNAMAAGHLLKENYDRYLKEFALFNNMLYAPPIPEGDSGQVQRLQSQSTLSATAKPFIPSDRKTSPSSSKDEIGLRGGFRDERTLSYQEASVAETYADDQVANSKVQEVDADYNDFITKLVTYHAECGTPLLTRPIVGGKPLDLLVLYNVVQARGYHQLGKSVLAWASVALKMGYESGNLMAAGHLMKDNFDKYLLTFALENTRLRKGHMPTDSSTKTQTAEASGRLSAITKVPEAQQDTLPPVLTEVGGTGGGFRDEKGALKQSDEADSTVPLHNSFKSTPISAQGDNSNAIKGLSTLTALKAQNTSGSTKSILGRRARSPSNDCDQGSRTNAKRFCAPRATAIERSQAPHKPLLSSASRSPWWRSAAPTTALQKRSATRAAPPAPIPASPQPSQALHALPAAERPRSVSRTHAEIPVNDQSHPLYRQYHPIVVSDSTLFMKKRAQMYIDFEPGLTPAGKVNLDTLLTRETRESSGLADYYVKMVERGVRQKMRMEWARDELRRWPRENLLGGLSESFVTHERKETESAREKRPERPARQLKVYIKQERED